MRRIATFANPEFYEAQRLRFSTWKIPRFIFCGDFDGRLLKLPRGRQDECIRLLEAAGAEPVIDDRRTKARRMKFTFRGELTPGQKQAVSAMTSNATGVLVAPPGAGKTVMACAIIAKRKARTLILVHRKPLVDQWRSRIETRIYDYRDRAGLPHAMFKKRLKAYKTMGYEVRMPEDEMNPIRDDLPLPAGGSHE